MFRIIRTRTNRQLNATIQELHDRGESERRRRLTADQRSTHQPAAPALSLVLQAL